MTRWCWRVAFVVPLPPWTDASGVMHVLRTLEYAASQSCGLARRSHHRCTPPWRMTFITWNVATLVYSAASTAPGVSAWSRAERAMLHKLVAVVIVVAVQEACGHHYDLQQLAAMRDGWIIHSSHLLRHLAAFLSEFRQTATDVGGAPMILGAFSLGRRCQCRRCMPHSACMRIPPASLGAMRTTGASTFSPTRW